MPKVFKVWTHDCHSKKAVVLTSLDNLLKKVLIKANDKLQIAGTSIVVAKDGTEVDDDEILDAFQNDGEIFMILQENETWSPISEEGKDDNSKITAPVNTNDTSKQDPLHSRQETSDFSRQHVQEIREINDPATERKLIQERIIPDINNDPILLEEGEEEEERINHAGPSTPDFENSCDSANTTTENKWMDFKIEWRNISTNKIEECEKLIRNINENKLTEGEKAKSLTRLRTYLINEVVEQMRSITKDIPMQASKIAAKQLLDKYPQIFEDVNHKGERLGNGFSLTANKIKNRNNLLKRPFEYPTLSSTLGIKTKNLRKRQMAEAGCIRWQPELKLTPQQLLDKKSFLYTWAKEMQGQEVETTEEYKNMSSEGKRQKAEKEFLFTFANQRHFLNNFASPPTATEIANNWPILLMKEFLLWHYKLLMGHSIDKMSTTLNEVNEKIFAFGHFKNISSNNEMTDEELFRILATFFKEDHDLLFKKLPVNIIFIYLNSKHLHS